MSSSEADEQKQQQLQLADYLSKIQRIKIERLVQKLKQLDSSNDNLSAEVDVNEDDDDTTNDLRAKRYRLDKRYRYLFIMRQIQ